MRRSVEFAAAVRRGRRAGRPLLTVHALLRPDEAAEQPRVGFAVSRAVGGAVTRNRVQRRLRHLVAERLHKLPGGSLVVVRARPPAARARSGELGADLDGAIHRVLQKRAEKP